MRCRNNVHLVLSKLNLHSVYFLRRNVHFETFKLLFSQQLIFSVVNAFFFPLLALHVVHYEFSKGLIIRVKSLLAVPVVAWELPLVAFGLAIYKTTFLYYGDPLILLRIGNRGVYTAFLTFWKWPKVHQSAVPIQRSGNIFPEKELMGVRIEHLCFPIADVVWGEIVEWIKHHLLFWILNALYVYPNIYELRRTLLQLNILEHIELLLVGADGSLKPRKEVLNILLNLFLKIVLAALQSLYKHRSSIYFAAEQLFYVLQILRFARILVLIFVQVGLLFKAFDALDNFHSHLSVHFLLILNCLLHLSCACIAPYAHLFRCFAIY